MKRTILFLLLTLVFFPKNNFGCECYGYQTFCEATRNSEGNTLENIMILRGEFNGYSSFGLEFSINEFILGERINQSKITFSIGTCTHFNGELEEGKEYIFSVKKIRDIFYVGFCYVFFLKIEEEMVKGNIAPGIDSIAYEKFGTLEDCGSSGFTDLKTNVLLYPNPTNGELKIKNTNTTRSLEGLELKIFDIIGRQHQGYQKVESILPNGIWNINLRNLAAGVYIIKLSEGHLEKTFRIVKQ